MIKIEIIDPHELSASVLKETGLYLMNLAELAQAPSINMPQLEPSVVYEEQQEPANPSRIFATVDLDSEGLPWDIRIHSRTRTKDKNGVWKKTRGAGPNTVKAVEEELRTVQAIPRPVDTESTPIVYTFLDLMTLITNAITVGKLTRDEVTNVLSPYGIPALPVVATRPDLIPELMVKIKEVIDGPC